MCLVIFQMGKMWYSMYANYNYVLCIVTADWPTVLECITFQGRERRIDIPQEIGSNYYHFGLHLLDDPNGTRVYNIERKHREDAERINREILQEWATGRGKNPVTWATLTEVLRDIDLCGLASEIEAVKLVSVETPEEELKLPLQTHSVGMCT